MANGFCKDRSGNERDTIKRVYKKQVEPFQHKIANVKSTPP